VDNLLGCKEDMALVGTLLLVVAVGSNWIRGNMVVVSGFDNVQDRVVHLEEECSYHSKNCLPQNDVSAPLSPLSFFLFVSQLRGQPNQPLQQQRRFLLPFCYDFYFCCGSTDVGHHPRNWMSSDACLYNLRDRRRAHGFETDANGGLQQGRYR